MSKSTFVRQFHLTARYPQYERETLEKLGVATEGKICHGLLALRTPPHVWNGFEPIAWKSCASFRYLEDYKKKFSWLRATGEELGSL